VSAHRTGASALSTRQSALRGEPLYCCECYSEEKFTVATRDFHGDPVCERHYLQLCKEAGIEPEAKQSAVSTQPSAQDCGAQALLPVTSVFPSDDTLREASTLLDQKKALKNISPVATQKGRTVVPEAQVAPLQHRGSSISGVVPGAGNGAKAKLSTGSPSRDISRSRRPDSTVAPAAVSGHRASQAATEAPAGDGIAEGLIPHLRPKNNVAAPAQKICGHVPCGKTLTERNKSGFCQGHFNDSRKAPVTVPKLCAFKKNGFRICDTPLRPHNKSGLCPPHRNLARPKPLQPRKEPPTSMEKRICRANEVDGYSCATTIGEACKSGFCAKHFHLSKRSLAPPTRKRKGLTSEDRAYVRRKTSGPLIGHVTPAGTNVLDELNLNGNGRVVRSITRRSMDLIWSKLSNEEAADLLFPAETTHA
jgi:hypothetical protein